MAPHESLSYRDAITGKWQVRAFDNKYPALKPGGSTARREAHGFFLSMDGVGTHEVIVETPVYNQRLAGMEVQGIERVLHAYRERYNTLRGRDSISAVVIFKNHGPSAGTSLIHSHSQLIATPVIPPAMRLRRNVAQEYYDRTGCCLYLDIMKHECEAGSRILHETKEFVVFHPFASKRPFETWIMPKTRQPSFGNATDHDLKCLADVLKRALSTLDRGLNNPDYNYVVHSAPPDEEDPRYFLWHLRIVPRLSTMAGFEIGSGICINPSAPEDTAEFIRGVSTGDRSESI